MSLFQVNKPKSAAKVMVPSSKDLDKKVLGTLDFISKMVGQTLGPGGRQVLLERPEINMKPIITKDGVTVIKHLGFDSAIEQLILEAARDAAVRTATEAGDGTTTATILSSAIARCIADAVANNSKLSPQKIVREMQAIVPWILEKVSSFKISADDEKVDYSEVLMKVATLSANGDTELAKFILEAMDLVGDEGNMTIVESNGVRKIGVEKISGYSIETGYEQSCRNMSNGFINDKTGTLVTLNNPIVILFDGTINDMSQIFDPLSRLGQYIKDSGRADNGIVLVAHGFSDSFVGDLFVNWTHPKAMVKIIPVLTPELNTWNFRTHFLYDLQAYTGSPVYNIVDKAIYDLDPEKLVKNSRVKKIEIGRFKSIIASDEDAEAIQIRVEELKTMLSKPESELESRELTLRIGKLTSGIARLNISGPTVGETRERRDRAEDAWMAIRGATRHGAVPGGGFVLVKLSADLYNKAEKLPVGAKKLATLILAGAMLEPVRTLYYNYGYRGEEIDQCIHKLLNNSEETYDILAEKWVNKLDLLDSLPAVTEAICNSISIASLLGTLGGIIAFKRDHETDKEEERFVRRFESSINERGSVNATET